MSRRVKILYLALVFVAGALPLPSQDKNSSQPEPEPERVRIVRLGRGITPPEPLPLTQPSAPKNCQDKISGKVRLAAVIDAEGRPQNLFFIEALGNDMDKLALILMDQERFKPAMQSSSAVAVGVSVELELNGCFLNNDGVDGKVSSIFLLRSIPTPKLAPFDDLPKEAAFGPTVTENASKDFAYLTANSKEPYKNRSDVIYPKQIEYTGARLVKETGKDHKSGTIAFTLVVDSNGMPRQIKIIRGLGAGYDQKAVEAIKGFRFRPAMKNGLPIAMPVMEEFNIHSY
jgi:TonB family protein